MRIYLVDNGSLRPESYLNLRRVAHAVSDLSGVNVLPVSLLHSSKIPAEELDGEVAMVWERQMKADLKAGFREFAILPFFFGPTGAILDYIPRRILALKKTYGEFSVFHFPFLAGNLGETRADLIELLADQIHHTKNTNNLNKPYVILVDHGSPIPQVAAVRNRVAEALKERLGDNINLLEPASMERRDGSEYAFNDPLLEKLLETESFKNRQIILSYLFLSPGRHAGPGGDITSICETAESNQDHLKVYHTHLVGQSKAIIPLLKERLSEPLRPIMH